MSPRGVIPIRSQGSGPVAAADEARMRLERAGYMRTMLIGEPRLSEFVAKYWELGYEVEVVPYAPEPGESGEGPPSGADAGKRELVGGTIYVRKSKRAARDPE